MLESDIAKPIKCSECHRVPTVLNSAGHLGTPAAEVSFSDTLANTRTNGVDIVANPPKLDTSKPDSIRCLNTYCHGNFTNGNKFSPIWTKVDNTQAACGTCHTLPPPPLHPPLAGCDIDCHNDEVAKVNGVLVIKDKAKHLNGKLNVFGQERVF
jgi:predicted CxxxxCH...CXXCH cytochrome family protein